MMKHSIIIALCMLVSTVFPFHLFAIDPVVIEGQWDKSGKRLLAVIPPEVSINDGTLSIHFRSAIASLSVKIMDEDGNVVYQTVISSSSNHTYELDWASTPGNYQLLLEHSEYGYLSGNFTIN